MGHVLTFAMTSCLISAILNLNYCTFIAPHSPAFCSNKYCLPRNIKSSIKASPQIVCVLVAIFQIQDVWIVGLFDASCPVDPLFDLHAEPDVVGCVDLQGFEWRSKLKSRNSVDVDFLLKVSLKC
jgi:hypothetical protein